jgi:hypothetical protein
MRTRRSDARAGQRLSQQKDIRVLELVAPEATDRPARAHLQNLIDDSLLRSAEAQAVAHRAKGQLFRARRAEKRAQRIRELTGATEPRIGTSRERFRTDLRVLTTAAWLGSCGLLGADLLAFGIHSWVTSVADVGVIILTMVWFFVSTWRLSPQND